MTQDNNLTDLELVRLPPKELIKRLSPVQIEALSKEFRKLMAETPEKPESATTLRRADRRTPS